MCNVVIALMVYNNKRKQESQGGNYAKKIN